MSESLDDDPLNPVTMSPQQRRSEIATILAQGVLRLRQMAHISHGSSTSRTAKEVPKPRAIYLDLHAQCRPDVIAE